LLSAKYAARGEIRLDGGEPRSAASVPNSEFLAGPRRACLTFDAEVKGGLNRIGRDRGLHAFTGVLHELMVFNRVLTDSEMVALDEHLRNEWD